MKFARPPFITYTCVLVAGLAITGLAQAQPSVGDKITLPEVSLITNETLTAKNTQDKATIIHYWATWCPFCLKQNANVQALYEQSKNTDLQILTVSTDDSTTEVENYLTEHNYDFPVTMQSPELDAVFGKPATVPTIFVVTEDGEVAEIIPGLMSDKDFMKLIDYTPN